MRSFLAAFVVATLVGTILTPLVRRMALKLGAVSTPGGRHVHERAIPRLGGLAVVGAFFAPLIGLFFVESSVAEAFRSDKTRVLGLFAGGLIMCGVGVLDDTRGVRALHKLLAQVLVATLAFSCGYRIEAVALPYFHDVQMGIFALPVTIIWIIGIVNAVNLIDGLDGLAAGVVFFACFTNFIVSHVAGVAVVSLLMVATMGAVVGFLFYNFNPARIFMGDSGSYFLGFVLAATSLAGGPKASTPVALLVPVIALGVPIFDVMLAMVRRVLERRSIFSPDRGHIHHRLLDAGITHRRAVLLIYGVSVLFAGAAIVVYLGRSWQVGGALLGASVVLIMLVRLARYFEYFQTRRRLRGSPRTEDVERLRRAVPRLAVELDRATSTAEVLEVLDGFCEHAQLYTCLLVERDSEKVVHSFTNPISSRREEMVARFPLGQSNHRPLDVKFTWPCEYGEVSPQAEVLLQVAVDLVEQHLGQVRSSLMLNDPFAASRDLGAPEDVAADRVHG